MKLSSMSLIGDREVACKSFGMLMKSQLGNDDRRAVDLLLDRDTADSGDYPVGTIATAMGGQLRQRIERVEKILNLLAEMPAGEPPANMLSRVRERIDEARARLPETTMDQPVVDASRSIM